MENLRVDSAQSKASSSPALPGRNRVGMLLTAVLVLGGPLLLLGSWSAPRLDYDDKIMIEENPLSRDGFTLQAIEQVARPPLGGFRGFYRQYTPLSHLTVGLQWALHGAQWWAFRLVNLLFHLGSALLLYQVILALMPRISAVDLGAGAGSARAGVSSTSAICAALGTAFFFFHPTNIESIAWAAERNNVQALFFAMLAWRLLLQPAAGSLPETGFPAPSARRFALTLAAYACALLSKPSAIGFSPLLALVELAWIEGPRKGRLLRGMSYLALAAAAAYVGLQAGRADLLPVTGGSLPAWAMTTLALVGRYLALALCPWPLSFFYGVEAVDTLLHPWIGIAAVLLIALTALFLWLLVERRYLWVLFPAALLALAPKLTPRTNAYLLQDRYLYIALPMAGALLALCAMAWRNRLRRLRPEFEHAMVRTGCATAALVCVLFASLSLLRSFDFGNSERLFRAAVKQQPRSYFARYLLAQKLLHRSLTEELPTREIRRLLEEAREQMQAARDAVDAERQNDPAEARLLEGEIDFRLRLSSAREHLAFVVRTAARSQVALRSKARWFLAEIEAREHRETKRYEPLEARAAFLQAILNEDPQNGKVLLALAETLERLGRTSQAAALYRRALSGLSHQAQAEDALLRLEER